MRIIINATNREDALKKVNDYFDEFSKSFEFTSGQTVYNVVYGKNSRYKLLRFTIVNYHKDKKGRNKYQVLCSQYGPNPKYFYYLEKNLYNTKSEAVGMRILHDMEAIKDLL